MNRLVIIACIVFTACTSNEKAVRSASGVDVGKVEQRSLQQDFGARTIEDISKFRWTAELSDTSKYLVQVDFKERYLSYWFHGQCVYDFFTYTYTRDTAGVDMYWAYATDCVLDLSYLEKANGVKRFPKPRDVFAEFRLLNDSTLEVHYEFPEWVRKVNQIAKDSIFPRRFHIYRASGA